MQQQQSLELSKVSDRSKAGITRSEDKKSPVVSEIEDESSSSDSDESDTNEPYANSVIHIK